MPLKMRNRSIMSPEPLSSRITRRETLIGMRQGIAYILGGGLFVLSEDEAHAALIGKINLRPVKQNFRPYEAIHGDVVFDNYGTKRVIVDGIMRISINGIKINEYHHGGQVALRPRETGLVVQIAEFVDTQGQAPTAPSLSETLAPQDRASNRGVDFRASVASRQPDFTGDEIGLKVGRYF